MKRTIIIISFLIVFIDFINAQVIKKDKIISIQAPVIADFENPAVKNLWILGESSPNLDKDTTVVQVLDGGPWGLAVPAEQKKYCLGLRAAFKSRGYNYLEILPPVFNMDLYPNLKILFQSPIPNPENERFIPIPGRCKTLDVWVSGRNYRYNVEVWLKDFNGYIYALDMGRIDFSGWRNLSKGIPGYVPQEEKYLPKEKPLKFIKYIIRAEPDERANKFYVYFDHMKAITDVYIERFDGDDTKDTW